MQVSAGTKLSGCGSMENHLDVTPLAFCTSISRLSVASSEHFKPTHDFVIDRRWWCGQPPRQDDEKCRLSISLQRLVGSLNPRTLLTYTRLRARCGLYLP